MKFLVALVAWAVWWPAGQSAALPLSDKDFKGTGRCQFAAHGFVLPAATERGINDSVQKLLERHETAFGFQTRPGFHLRIRVFARFEDYTNATLSLYFTNAMEQRMFAGRMMNVAGFYAPQTKEIVTWRQQLPGVLGNTLLHEASHAIMDAHYDDVPLWLMEGSAEYFALVLYPLDELHQFLLRDRWTSLNRWLKENKLLPLATLLNADGAAFHQLDQEKAYAMSWSLFQLFMSPEVNRRAMLGLLHERQVPYRRKLDSAEQMARLYPGGLPRLEADWHARIRAGAGITNSPNVKYIRVDPSKR